MTWDKEKDPNRRYMNRRFSDKICPYADDEFGISCPAVIANRDNIKDIVKDIVKKEELVDIKTAIKSLEDKKAPRWVVVTMITTAVPIMIALMVWIGSRLGVISDVAANQKVIMRAFDIEAVPKDFDNQKK